MVRVEASVVTSGEKMAAEPLTGLPPSSGLVSVVLAGSISRFWGVEKMLVFNFAS
jgi:hypothetical protein